MHTIAHACTILLPELEELVPPVIAAEPSRPAGTSPEGLAVAHQVFKSSLAGEKNPCTVCMQLP